MKSRTDFHHTTHNKQTVRKNRLRSQSHGMGWLLTQGEHSEGVLRPSQKKKQNKNKNYTLAEDMLSSPLHVTAFSQAVSHSVL